MDNKVSKKFQDDEKRKDGSNSKITIKEFDDLFKYIGGIGPFQVCHILFIGALAFLSTDSLFINFFGADTEHWCRVPQLQDLPFKVQKEVAIPYSTDDSSEYESCRLYALNYSAYSVYEYLLWNRSQRIDASTGTLDCNHGWTYDKSEFVSTIRMRWDLVCDDSWLVDLLSTILIAGFGVGALSTGEISDRIGRKNALVLLNLLRIGAQFLIAWAPTYEIFAIGRFFQGFGSHGNYIAAYVLMIELTEPSWRPLFGSIGSMIYSFGYMLVPGLAYAIRDYQKLLFLHPCLCILPLAYYWLLPESARWLVVKGKKVEAEKTLRKIARINGYTWPENIDLEQLYMNQPAEKPKRRNPLDLFKRPAMRKYTLCAFYLWFCASLIYYALSLNSGSLAGDLFLNTFLLGAVEFPAALLNMFLLTKGLVGRRTLACTTFLSAGVVSFISIPLILDGSQDTATLILALIGKGAATMAFAVIYTYSSEIYPTEYRNVGIGGASLSARISGMAAPYVGGVLVDVWEPLPFLIYGVFGTTAGLVALLLPETRGLKLPQTIDDVEELARSLKKPKKQRSKYSEEENGAINKTYL